MALQFSETIGGRGKITRAKQEHVSAEIPFERAEPSCLCGMLQLDLDPKESEEIYSFRITRPLEGSFVHAVSNGYR
jgi:hypothetical protein